MTALTLIPPADIRRRLAHVKGEDTPLFANGGAA